MISQLIWFYVLVYHFYSVRQNGSSFQYWPWYENKDLLISVGFSKPMMVVLVVVTVHKFHWLFECEWLFYFCRSSKGLLRQRSWNYKTAVYQSVYMFICWLSASEDTNTFTYKEPQQFCSETFHRRISQSIYCSNGNSFPLIFCFVNQTFFGISWIFFYQLNKITCTNVLFVVWLKGGKNTKSGCCDIFGFSQNDKVVGR